MRSLGPAQSRVNHLMKFRSSTCIQAKNNGLHSDYCEPLKKDSVSRYLLAPIPSILTKVNRKTQVITPFQCQLSRPVTIHREPIDHLDRSVEAVCAKKHQHDKPQKTYRRTLIVRKPLLLIDFRPNSPPFIPNIVRRLINAIEVYCYAHSWSLVFKSLNAYHEEAKTSLLAILHAGNDSAKLKKLIRRMSPPVQIVTFRLFFEQLESTLIYFRKFHSKMIAEEPLYDKYFNPNRDLPHIVLTAVTHKSRVETDTLAFVMIHLLHALEYSSDPAADRTRLARIYGRIFVGFSERPIMVATTGSVNTIEAALMEAILHSCDQYFWNHMSILQVRGAFKRCSRIDEFLAICQQSRINSSLKEYYARRMSSLTGPTQRHSILRSHSSFVHSQTQSLTSPSVKYNMYNAIQRPEILKSEASIWPMK